LFEHYAFFERAGYLDGQSLAFGSFRPILF